MFVLSSSLEPAKCRSIRLICYIALQDVMLHDITVWYVQLHYSMSCCIVCAIILRDENIGQNDIGFYFYECVWGVLVWVGNLLCLRQPFPGVSAVCCSLVKC